MTTLATLPMLKTYLNFIFRSRWFLAIAFIGLFIFCITQAKHLKLKSDFKELLPETFQSVIDLNKIVERIGGNGSLIVAIESNDPEASIRFGEELVAKLKQYPPEMIRRVEYNAETAKKFFLDHKYLYMDLQDIKAIHDRLERRIGKEKLKKSGVYLEFETDEESKKSDNFEDIKEKYTSKTSAYEHYYKGYFFDENQKLMAIVIRPPGSAIGIEFSKKLISSVENTIREINPQKFDPNMNVRLTGHFKRVLFEYQTLYEDIVSTAGLCILLVGISVFIYYRRLRMVVLMAWATFNGTLWAFAITAWKIGYLTTQTAFLGSIIIGNGINHGLILMARYLEERRLGKSPLEALHISIPATLTGTLTSSVTTTLSFGVLMMSDMRGFSQFGFIGGLGMFFCWLSTYTVLPVFLILTEEIF
ncbi:MAG: MMPL family transporter [Deltaproteobacteria bacterium]|nr:MAG: MMPL family transporter [Deltaproteobacteria bacterium]